MPLIALFLACCPNPPVRPAELPPRTVSVSATARINVVPDEATVALTFSATASGMRKSHASATSAVETFKGAVLKLGVSADALELCGTTDNPNYRWDGSNRVIGYTSTTLLNVRLKDFERVADVVDTAVASGVTAVDVNYHSTTLPEHKKHARDLALAAAKEKATQLATGAGATLGPVQQLSEGAAQSGGFYRATENAVQTEVFESTDGGDAISPGTTPLELTVQATFALE